MSFSPQTALLAAQFSAAAYQRLPEIDGWEIDTFGNNQTDIHGIVGYRRLGHHGIIEKVVAFRGTASIENWLTDIRVRRARFDGQQLVHSGFYEAYRSILDMQPVIEKPTLITGHSLGGALAVLYAATAPGMWDGIPLYTFGQPRVGNRAFASAVWKRFPDWWRVIDRADIVARVAWLFGLYRHRGNVAFVDEAGHVDINPPRILRLHTDIAAIWHEWKLRRGIALAHDHHMGLYLHAMRRAAYRGTP